MLFSSTTRMPCAFNRAAVRSELATAPSMRFLIFASSSMKKLAVDPVPTPAGIVIKSAAVADFHLSAVPLQKVKKTAARISLELDPTPDILAELGRKKGDRLLIGFAAETQNLQQEARRKLESKNCDMVVGNLVGGNSDAGFESEYNEVILALSTGETISLPRAPKREIAERIFDEVLKLRLALHAAHGK